MFKEPRPVQEIHAIQEKIYEEEKKMTVKQRLDILHKKAKAAKQRLGLKIKKFSPAY